MTHCKSVKVNLNPTATRKFECQVAQAIEAALLGLASLALTLANILCIVLTGIAILRQAFAHFTYSQEE